jgi:hypothetical protein
MTRTGQAAIDAANAAIGENVMPPGFCLQFTRECFDVAALYGSAIDAWNGARWRHEGDRNPPPAVPVWFATSSVYDHVAIRTEDAYVVSTFNDDVRLFTDIADIERQFDGSFLGWAEDINGVRVYTQEDDMPSADEVAAAVWGHPIAGADPVSGTPWSDSAAAWLRDARTAAVPALHAGAVWDHIITGTNPSTGEPWSDVADAWVRDARIDSYTPYVAGTTAAAVWSTAPVVTSRGLTALAILLMLAVIGGVALALAVDAGVGIAAAAGALIGGAVVTLVVDWRRSTRRPARHE